MSSHDSDGAFDLRAKDYEKSDWHFAYGKRLVELLAPQAGARVLDACCGTGIAALNVASRTSGRASLVGIDSSPHMLERAKDAGQNLKLNIRWVLGDATEVPRELGKFDLIMCSAGIHLLDYRRALVSWRRSLTSGGTVGFSVMKAGQPPPREVFLRTCGARGLRIRTDRSPLGDRRACVTALEHAGFRHIEVFEEEIQFGEIDLRQAWQVHRTTYRSDLSRLSTEELQDLRADYEAALAREAERSPGLPAQVMYAVASI